MAKKSRISRREWLVVLIAFLSVTFLSSLLLWNLHIAFRWACIGSGIGVIVLIEREERTARKKRSHN